MKKLTWLTGISLVMMVVAGTAFADWGPRGRMGGPGGQGYGFRDLSSLTAAQKSALEEEHKAFFDATRDLFMQLRQKRLELKAEMAKKSPDSNLAKGLQEEISGMQGQLAQKRLAHMLKIKEIAPEISAMAFDGGFGGNGRHRGAGRANRW